jgi:hypothetical protein
MKFSGTFATMAVAGFASLALAQEPLPITSFARLPAIEDVSLSPDGHFMSAVQSVGDTSGAVVFDLQANGAPHRTRANRHEYRKTENRFAPPPCSRYQYSLVDDPRRQERSSAYRPFREYGERAQARKEVLQIRDHQGRDPPDGSTVRPGQTANRSRSLPKIESVCPEFVPTIHQVSYE